MGRHKDPNSAFFHDTVTQPNDWDKAVSAAYLRLLGASQAVTAKEAGVGERTLRTWETCGWWVNAEAEARSRWLRGGDAAAMRGIQKGLKSDSEYAVMSRWWADRRIEELKPPNLQVDATVGGVDGGPVRMEVILVKPDDNRQG